MNKDIPIWKDEHGNEVTFARYVAEAKKEAKQAEETARAARSEQERFSEILNLKAAHDGKFWAFFKTADGGVFRAEVPYPPCEYISRAILGSGKIEAGYDPFPRYANRRTYRLVNPVIAACPEAHYVETQ